MIDFKYHVVSIVAVFLALAVGIVLGTNVLSGDVLSNLKSQTNELRKEAQDLRAQNQQQQNQLNADQDFLQALEPMAVAGKLQGRGVVVISVPGASKDVRQNAVKTLVDAGAIVTAQVDLDASYDDPAKATALNSLVDSLGLSDPANAGVGDVASRAGAALASALAVAPSSPSVVNTGSEPGAPKGSPAAVTSASGSPSSKASATDVAKASATPSSTTPPPTSAPPTSASPTPPTSGSSTGAPIATRLLDPASITILTAFQKAGFVKLSAQPLYYGDLVVVVGTAAPASPATPDPTRQAALLDLVSALQDTGAQAVVIGPTGSADAGGLVAQTRGDAKLSKSVSGVDDADTTGGLIAMVYALRAQLAGTVGQYGTGQGARAQLATVTPSPSTKPAGP